MVEIHIYDESTDSFFPEYVACTGCSCENAINRAKEVLKMQGYKVMYIIIIMQEREDLSWTI